MINDYESCECSQGRDCRQLHVTRGYYVSYCLTPPVFPRPTAEDVAVWGGSQDREGNVLA